MARIRSIKPDFWTDEKVVELSAFARLLFIGLWNFADDDGRMVYSPKKIKMQIFPADTVDISELIGEIAHQELITVYTVSAVAYVQIAHFSKHQKIDKRTPSKLPAYSNGEVAAPESCERSPVSSEDLRVTPTEGKGSGGGKGKGVEEEWNLKHLGKTRGTITSNASTSLGNPEKNHTEQDDRQGDRQGSGQEGAQAYLACPHQKIKDLWHTMMPELPRVVQWTDTRAGHLKARWRELCAHWHWESEDLGLIWFTQFFESIRGSPFLMGRVSSKDRKPFVASLDWAVKPENFTKILEGKYHS
ncbi:hypothetical protein ICN48_13405 [Polynucleobacter sp. JS-Safj-400b-B2]|uniref:hypothetical protein n=1 Tax=Polynucleobacter sp. JS-Safj-400b-B2 TaxID=2576921 RepID=UPI001C0DCFE5|nr:hypothetical protein [Polynucleobacter sp. JS-Safj-400b-B2]MBU3627223.1 hypothetical protein [Polynucleobacter sp. JS-Safj-400b-B2]